MDIILRQWNAQRKWRSRNLWASVKQLQRNEKKENDFQIHVLFVQGEFQDVEVSSHDQDILCCFN